MSSRFLLEALDRQLRDITDNPAIPFGGKIIVTSGDFRQILPVIKKASRPQIVNQSLNRSKLWPLFEKR